MSRSIHIRRMCISKCLALSALSRHCYDSSNAIKLNNENNGRNTQLDLLRKDSLTKDSCVSLSLRVCMCHKSIHLTEKKHFPNDKNRISVCDPIFDLLI